MMSLASPNNGSKSTNKFYIPFLNLPCRKKNQRPSLASAGSSLPWRVSIAMLWALIFSPRLWGISIVVDVVFCRGDDVECARNMPPAVLMPMCPWSNERSVRTRCLCHIRKFFRKGGMGGEKGEKMGVFFSGGEDLEVFMCAMVWCHIDVTSRWRHWPIRSGDLEKPLWGIPKKGRTVQVLLVSLVGIFFGGISTVMCIYIYTNIKVTLLGTDLKFTKYNFFRFVAAKQRYLPSFCYLAGNFLQN